MTSHRGDLWRSMGLSVRIVHCFIGAGIETWEQLSGLSDAELLRIPNFGPICLREIRAVSPDPTLCPTCHGTGRVKL